MTHHGHDAMQNRNAYGEAEGRTLEEFSELFTFGSLFN